jgi:BirA family biotin operon repressor/biotin-[acetyl-CoA-carboxylase] ligase
VKRFEFDSAVAGLDFQRAAFFETIGSTNDVVAGWAREGTTGPAIAAADEQTQGRGRSGRRWLTPPGSALAFSLLLDTANMFDNNALGRASGLGSLAVCEALETSFDLQPFIKWPNDVLLNGKKVCGVLPEAHWSGERLQALILGIGINVAAKSLPDLAILNFPATSVEVELGHPINTAALLRAVLESLLAWRPRLGQPEFLRAWEGRLAYRGETVMLETGEGEQIEAELIGLSSNGALKLHLASGERIFQAGEIHLRPLVDTQSK